MPDRALTITLTPELDRALSDLARRQGTTRELLALESLRQRFLSWLAPEEPAAGETLADFLSDHIGVLHSSEHVPGGARMSENCGKKFAAGLLERHRQQR